MDIDPHAIIHPPTYPTQHALNHMPHTHSHTHTHSLTHTLIHIQKGDSVAQRKKTDAPTPDDRGKSLLCVVRKLKSYIMRDIKYGITDNRAFTPHAIYIFEGVSRYSPIGGERPSVWRGASQI